MFLNRVIMIGNLTRDPESRFTPQGVQVVNTGLAVNRFTKNERGDYDVDFFNLVAFTRTAQYMADYLKKGNRIALEGRLQSRSWDDATTGQKRTVYEIVVDNVQNLTTRQSEDAAENGAAEEEGADPWADTPITEEELAAHDVAPVPAPARPAAQPQQARRQPVGTRN